MLACGATAGSYFPCVGGSAMSTTHTSDRFTALPDDQTLAATVVALEEHGFSVEVADDLDAARQAVLARIPEGSSVMTNTSVTLAETGIADAINDGGPYESVRNKMMALDFATQVPEMKAIAGQPARLLRLGRRQRHLRRRRAEARSHPGGGARADLPAQPEARGRPRVRRLRAEQLRREGSGDPPGTARPHPRRPHPAAGRLLTGLASSAARQPAPGELMTRHAMRQEQEPAMEPVDEAVDHVRGSPAGRLIVEYGDYECPYSRQAFQAIERVERELGECARFAFRHFPLTGIHPHALAAAAAAEAAALQGRFWDMHELLFHRQKALGDGDLRGYAAQLGLDVAAFDRDRASTAVAERIRRDVDSGRASGQVLGTPTLFIDGVVHRGGYDPPTLLAALAP